MFVYVCVSMCVWSFCLSLCSQEKKTTITTVVHNRIFVNVLTKPDFHRRRSDLRDKRHKKIRILKRIQRFIYPFPDAPGRSQTQYEDDRPNDLETKKIKYRKKIFEI